MASERPYYYIDDYLLVTPSHQSKVYYIKALVALQSEFLREGISEVDVTISYKDGIIFIEAKYLAPVNLRTTSDPRRDQIIRYLDLAAYHYLNHPDAVKEFYFVLIIDTEKPPWILTRYKFQHNLINGLTHHGLFQVNQDVSSMLSKGIGWLT
jgi:hypothetical protein